MIHKVVYAFICDRFSDKEELLLNLGLISMY